MTDHGSPAAAASAPRSWRLDPAGVRPTVLLVGGFLTSPPLYRRVAARLRTRGAAEVVVAPVWIQDWLLAAGRGLGPIVTRTGRALLRAAVLSGASPVSRGTPVLVIGHSAGGMTARLLTSPERFEGRRLAGAGRIGAIVTLGTPHAVAADGDIGSKMSARATAFASRTVPGATYAPLIGYLSVAGRGVEGRLDGDGRARTAHRFYRGLLGSAAAGRATIEGDGLVPLECARLEGATQLVLDDTQHSPFAGAPWYGSETRIDLWWPAALDAWNGALQARLEAAAGAPRDESWPAHPDAPRPAPPD